MAEPTISVAVTCSTAGLLCIPVLLELGIDPASGIGGAVGVVMVQTLLPAGGARSYRELGLLTIGSVLLASMLSPAVAPFVIKGLSTLVQEETCRGLTAALVGGFAQPIAIWMKVAALPGVLKRFKAAIAGRSGGDDGR